ncbi:cellulase family glycosylhydrolase [Glycomyces algeriensis]|uniref:Endoglucanase n=1 Tax=Glycomyces algeriensis TaxID=256037 RepID=A0A9W6GD28_9ACTN|nr:cellulase family glycosylhydrolase [Glycomyces algeriensis]MDA1368374.1 cellulase family glycosylhydrolase [Glycomyces algeriensis]MDR7351817.1 aryl-phospho-beta-D-glucosidase BglC (GH1 family) [Glycomyces algeriensis]GLI44544.1 endoglucanase [Glycomyces algeriensis]
MRRKPIRLIAALVAVAAAVAAALTVRTAFAEPETPPEDGAAVQLGAEATVAAMQPGWNLGNSLDAVGEDETAWGNPRITPELLDSIRAQGFNSIRIPVTWSAHQAETGDYAIDAAYLARVQEVVDLALEDGFYVLINIHHDSWQWVNQMPTRHDEVLARYNAAWTQIAGAFADAPPELVFENINEPQFADVGEEEGDALLNELNESFHAIVRGSGGVNAQRLLVIPTLHTSSEQARLDAAAASIAALDDPMIAATVHYYGYWPFSVNVAGYTTFNEEVRGDIVAAFDRVKATFIDQGVPVILGEWGLLGFDKHTGVIEQGEKLKFFEYLGYYANEVGMTTMWWDNGQHFDRGSHTWKDPDLFAHVAGAWAGRSGTAASDQVYVPAGEAPAAAAVPLQLNGLEFAGVFNGDTELAAGTDYTLDGEQLTLSAGLLASLADGAALGERAVLEVRFSSGVPWKLHIIASTAPAVQDATGTTTELAVPVAFNGDQLATMEAVYPDGTPAGPQDWTAFKEFAVAFTPDYEAGKIVLPEAFFAAVDDNATVNLTFHFWSGKTIEYTVERSGTVVTGSAA